MKHLVLAIGLSAGYLAAQLGGLTSAADPNAAGPAPANPAIDMPGCFTGRTGTAP